MQIAAYRAPAIARARAHDAGTHPFIGPLIVSLFPALFWMAVVAGIGAAAGHTPTPAALMTFGAAVAAFLALVCQALFSRS